ncbi:MAG: DoxX family protein [Vampirovibrionales bacterium]|nr:DoxX family protein [Vampirovibrionales bacterium]
MFNVYRSLLLQDTQSVSLAKLLVRLAFGIGMSLHGLAKLGAATSWMGPDSPIPPVLQLAAALAEFAGGIGFALGLLSPIASIAIVLVMIGALGLVHLPSGDPYVSPTGGASSELATLYLTVGVLGFISGPGKYSLDYLLLQLKGANRQPLSNS